MPLKKIQKDVDEWVSKFNPPYWPALEQFTRLAEETGEVARELNHLHGIKKKKAEEDVRELGQELADVIFTVCCIANSHKIDLQNEWEIMKEKKFVRDKERFNKL